MNVVCWRSWSVERRFALGSFVHGARKLPTSVLPEGYSVVRLATGFQEEFRPHQELRQQRLRIDAQRGGDGVAEQAARWMVAEVHVQPRALVAHRLETELLAITDRRVRLRFALEKAILVAGQEPLRKVNGYASDRHVLDEPAIAKNLDIRDDIADPHVVLRMREELEYPIDGCADLDRFLNLDAPAG